jgi:predicted nucleotidyltransferase
MVTHLGYQRLKRGPIWEFISAWTAIGVFAMMVAMKRTDAISRLKRQADALKALGATSLFLFGSVARDEAGPDSDLDLFIDYDAAKKFSLIDLAGIKLFLEDAIEADVDVTTRNSLHPKLKDRIESSAIRIF